MSGFGTVARRVTAWTTNCLVSAIIIVAGLGFGRQVLLWWSEDASPPAARPPAADWFANPSVPHSIEFGNQSWAMSRRSMQGNAERALAELRTVAAALTRQSTIPDEPATPAEQKLLDRLSREKPILEQPGAWQVHQFGGPFPMVAGILRGSSRTEAPGGTQLAATTQRVVTWGLGLPAGKDEWTFYTFSCSGGGGEPFPGLSNLGLPPGATQTLNIRATDGGAAVAFQGPQEADDWKDFFDAWFHDQGWAAGSWRRNGSSWHLRARSGGEKKETTIDVQFGPRADGRLEGLLVVSAARAPVEEHR